MTPVPEVSPIMAAFHSREPQLTEDARVDHMPPTARQLVERFGVRSLAVVPLISAGEAIGTIGLSWTTPRAFDADEQEFLGSLGAEVALGLQSARSFRAVQHQGLLGRSLAHAAELLAASLDIEAAMPEVLAVASGALGAIGASLILRERGGWRTAATHGYADPVGDGFHTDEESPTFMQMLDTQEPIVLADVNEASPQAKAMAEQIGYRAAVIFPVLYRGQIVGGLSFLYRNPKMTLSEEDRHFMSRLAFIAGVTEENARLYQSEHRIAETLQAALLAMPEEMPGIDFAHVYSSATEATRVGGDFYDIFDLNHQLVGVIVGDVAGKGLNAVVLTSLVKNTIRAHATEKGNTPARILHSRTRSCMPRLRRRLLLRSSLAFWIAETGGLSTPMRVTRPAQ